MMNTIIKISFKRKTPKFSETRYNHIACVCGCWSREPTWNPLYLVQLGGRSSMLRVKTWLTQDFRQVQAT